MLNGVILRRRAGIAPTPQPQEASGAHSSRPPVQRFGHDPHRQRHADAEGKSAVGHGYATSAFS